MHALTYALFPYVDLIHLNKIYLLGRPTPARPWVGAIAFPNPPWPWIMPGCIPGTGRAWKNILILHFLLFLRAHLVGGNKIIIFRFRKSHQITKTWFQGQGERVYNFRHKNDYDRNEIKSKKCLKSQPSGDTKYTNIKICIVFALLLYNRKTNNKIIELGWTTFLVCPRAWLKT